jgi:uncharacterized repeat protein (TIGR01451 family)
MPFLAHSSATVLRLLALLAWLCACPAFAQGPVNNAPSEIVNQAQARYTNAQGDEIQLVSTTVSALLSSATATFTITKTTSTATPKPGDEVTFGINAAQKSGALASGFEVSIDGQTRTQFILRDTIPAKTTFARFAAGNLAGATQLYHVRGQATHTYVTTPPADLSQLDAVALGFDAMPVDSTVPMRFVVKLAQTASGVILNTAQLFAIQGAGATATASLSNTVRLTATPPADPYGVIFDSRKNTPVSGARVTLVDAATGQPAQVFKQNGAPAPNSVITGPDGRYSFPVVAPGSYRLEIIPPPEYDAPSKRPAAQLPPGRFVDPNASYGLAFIFDPASGQMRYDIPVDRVESGLGLFVQKLASRETAEIGDFVDYVIRVKNVSGRLLTDVVLDDRLPHGFVFIPETARLNGTSRLSSASGNRGPKLKFSLGTIDRDQVVSVTYRARLGPDAPHGDGTNRAQAQNQSAPQMTSNEASVTVQVVEGVFTKRGIILGKVFVDLNRNRVQDPGEVGVPGIRLYIEDGSYVVTDGEGKYSFYGLTPRTHVLKLDKLTLPVGAKLGVLDTRNAGTGGSRFVELKNSEMHKANFAIVDPSPAVLRRIEELRAAAAKLSGETDRSLKADLQRDDTQRSVTDRRSMPSSGIILPGVAVQPTQDERTESAGSLILNDQRMQFAPTIQRGKYGEPLIPNLPKPQAGPLATPPTGAPRTGITAPGASAPAPATAPAATPRASQPALDAPIPFGPPAPAVFDSVMPGSDSGAPNDLALFNIDPIMGTTAPPDVPLATAAATADAKPTAAPAAPTLGFLDFKNGDTLPTAQAMIRVQGKAGGALRLKVNGEIVPDRRIGKRVTMNDRGLELLEFIGVPLKPGTNQLELQQLDPFGNARGKVTIEVIAPDKLGQIRIELPSRERPADGNTPTRAIIHLLDASGVPVTARTELTLEASLGLWNAEDLNPDVPGVQVFIEGGHAEFDVQPPIEPGDCRLRVSSGVLVAEEKISFLPDLRPMLAVGVIEGRVNISKLSAGSLTNLNSRDTFEQELREFSVGNGDTTASGRAAFFIKGKIKGSYLLTAAYDSERETKERLFRDIQPDEFYPVYGDASVKGFEAQSTGALYVRIDNKKSYLLYGDFTTQSAGDVRQLGNYNRSLTGIKQHFENSRIAANAWATYDTTRQVIEEVRANGTSGPYFFNLQRGNALGNSEKVEILTRDRNNPGLIIKTESRTRFSDYELEPFTGRVLFKAPIPSLDENLNPLSIRVTYEADQGGDKFWTYGADAQVKVTNRFEVGGSYVREENPITPFTLYSTNAVYQLGKGTFLLGEWARTEDELLGAGNAYRFELRHLGENSAARIFWGRAELGFRNPSALLQSGRTEGGAQFAFKLGPNTRLLIEGVDSETELGGSRRGVMAAVEQTLWKDVRFEVGGRYAREDGGAATATSLLTPGATPNEMRTARAKLTVPMPWTAGAGRLFGEYEQDLFDPEKRLAAIGGDYQLDAKTRLYARHELISSLGSPYDLNSVQRQNSTIVGVESTYMKDAQLFNEFRMRDAISGREAEAALGLRNTWPLARGLRAMTTFERISPVALRQTDPVAGELVQSLETTAITGALEYTDNPDWKGTARLELRTSQQTDSLLNTLGIAWKVNRDWTFLGKTILYLTDQKIDGTANQEQARIQLGMAWRPNDSDRWNALMKYEFKTETGTLSGSALGNSFDDAGNLRDGRRTVQIVSVDVNYQPTASLVLSGHYAGKYASEDAYDTDGSATAHLLAGRVIFDLTRKFDVGLNASVLFSEGGVRYGIGPEIGYTLHENLRAGIGYNFIGFTDRDLSEEQYTQEGVYLALRWKFDEETFQRRRKEEVE